MTPPAPTRLIRRFANGIWVASCGPEFARFSAALKQVERTQQGLLLDLLRRNAGTGFGRRHGFADIRRVEDYQKRVPVTGYEGYAEAIDAIARGEPNVLTRERVGRFQITSGSTSVSKLIPWTASAAAEFRRGIASMLYAMYRRHPSMLGCSAYWSVSPPSAPKKTSGNLDIGFDRDSSYLGFFAHTFFNLVSAVGERSIRTGEIGPFRDQCLATLLADDGLGFVSVWSPTFLTILLDHFLARRDVVLDLIASRGGRRARARADELRSLTAQGRLEPGWPVRAWPNLRVISCWTTGPSEIYAARLQALFPGVELQGKGLIAAEAFVSLPLTVGVDPVISVRSHFLEFQAPDTGAVHLAHQLKRGQTYRVIVTTGSGLYRYSLGDLVRVTGFIGEAPCLRFIAREGNVSDLFGEKLSGWFVQQAVSHSFETQGVAARFFLLAPVASDAGTHYALFLETDPHHNLAGLASRLERSLMENPHYDHCRHIGQLGACRVFLLDPAGPDGTSVYYSEMIARGLKLGDVKLAPLDPRTGWESRFQGRFLP